MRKLLISTAGLLLGAGFAIGIPAGASAGAPPLICASENQGMSAFCYSNPPRYFPPHLFTVNCTPLDTAASRLECSFEGYQGLVEVIDCDVVAAPQPTVIYGCRTTTEVTEQ